MYRKNVYFSVRLTILEILSHKVIMECANQYVHPMPIQHLSLPIIRLKDVYLSVHKVKVHLEIQLLFHVLKYAHLAGMLKEYTQPFLLVIVCKHVILILGVRRLVELAFRILSIVLLYWDTIGMLIIRLLHVLKLVQLVKIYGERILLIHVNQYV